MKLSRSHSLFFSCMVYMYAHGLPCMCVGKPGVNTGISLSVALHFSYVLRQGLSLSSQLTDWLD